LLVQSMINRFYPGAVISKKGVKDMAIPE